MKNEQPLVLLSNDDGHGAPGIHELAAALRSWADVYIVAPEHEQSALSHAITLHRALRLRHLGTKTFAVDGTPADCVYLGIFGVPKVLPRRPDLVVSGINRGLNLGYDVYYSGTVAAAREAAMRGIPAVACSADMRTDLHEAALVCSQIAQTLFHKSEAGDGAALLNVNIPQGKQWELRATRLGKRIYGEGVDFRVDPRGKEYFWIGGSGVQNVREPGSDTEAFDQGHISVCTLPLLPRAESADDLALELIRAIQ
jgi:5'-nucleotidase